MKSLLVLCVVLCAALSVRAATVLSAEDVAVKEEDVVAPVGAVEAVQESIKQAPEDEDINASPQVEAAEELMQQAPEDEGVNASPQVRFGNCPGNWHGYQGKCYLMVNELRTWSDAEAHCSSQQASLASAHSFWEYSFLQQLARTAGHSYAWMGGYYFQSRWRWDDGTVYSYQNCIPSHLPAATNVSTSTPTSQEGGAMATVSPATVPSAVDQPPTASHIPEEK